jgi:hypothetical protein
MPAIEESIFYEPKGVDDLRGFLKTNKEKYHEIWIVLIKKEHTTLQPVSFNEAVREAIAQGLVDSRTKPLDNSRYTVRFTKRKSKKA